MPKLEFMGGLTLIYYYMPICCVFVCSHHVTSDKLREVQQENTRLKNQVAQFEDSQRELETQIEHMEKEKSALDSHYETLNLKVGTKAATERFILVIRANFWLCLTTGNPLFGML